MLKLNIEYDGKKDYIRIADSAFKVVGSDEDPDIEGLLCRWINFNIKRWCPNA